jgi:hypothetical protein
MDNGHTCEVHPFGCMNSLVLNWEDYGVGIVLQLWLVVRDELACSQFAMMELMDVPYVLLHKNMQLGRMGKGWMGQLSA